MNIFEELSKIVKEFEDEQVRYALIGGVAMSFYSEPRFTRDVDLLIYPEDFSKAKVILENAGFFESTEPWSFRKVQMTLHRFLKMSREDEMMLDLLIAETDNCRKMILESEEAEAEQGVVRVAKKEDLIQLKSIRDSEQDRLDIKRLKNEKDQ